MLYIIKQISAALLVKLLLILSVYSFSFSAIAATSVDSVRLWRAPDHTRVVLDTSGQVSYKLFSLDNPHRLVIDIDSASNKAGFNKLTGKTVENTPISRVRTAVRNGNDLRLVFDLKEEVKPRSFLLAPNKDKPHRLVIDLYDQKVTTQKTVKKILDTPAPTKKDTNKTAAKRTLRDIIVVVDAGHGGEDPGAIGPKKIQEKDVVLDIAKRLAVLINKEKGYKAILTRDGDYFIPLRKRRDKAREVRADLFISIHADAFTNPQANGASVFALSQRGATSETARFLAKQENDADLIGGVGDVSLEDKDEVLRGVLVDLSMTATVGASLDVGKSVLGNMKNIARLHKKQVEQAGFLVLKSPDVPSILVETGFISNPTEAKRLASASFRQKMASSIFTGTKSYFNRKPPAGSYVEWKKNGSKESDLYIAQSSSESSQPAIGQPQQPLTTLTYKVKSGDSLSEIAQKYRVSTAKIKKLNNLKSNTIRIGQVLTIAEKKSEPVRKLVTHKVKRGETLSEIAQQYKISSATLRKRNRLSSSMIQVGQTLIIAN